MAGGAARGQAEGSILNRIVIGGVPRAGKTTLAEKLLREAPSTPILHTDDLMGEFDWSGVSDAVSLTMDDPAPWIIEGVAAVRALRKWLKRNPEGKPCDKLIWLACAYPDVTLGDGQARMAKACNTIFAEIEAQLLKRSVVISSEC